jgi:hypothetical protein
MPVLMLRPVTAKSTIRAALGCAVGFSVLLAASNARAGDSDVPIDTKIFRGIMEGLGLQRDGQGINYRERPPLVIPPSRNLPPPEAADSAIAKNPAWPNDPDVDRAKKEAAAQRTVSMNPDDTLRAEQNPLPPDKIAPGPKPRKTQRTDDGYRASPTGSGTQLSPSQLGSTSNLFGKIFEKEKPEVGTFTAEPPRVSLTQPPVGYQTPSPTQPYGKNTPDAAPKAYDYATQHGVDPD